MFLKEQIQGSIIFYFSLLFDKIRRFPLEMDDLRLGDMVYLPTCLFHSIAPICLFKKKKVILIQQSYLFHSIPFHHHASTDRKSTRLNSSHGYTSYAVF